MTHSKTHLWLGLVALAVALAVALVWVPLDSATGLVEKVRRKIVIGDALAPTVAAGFVGLGGLLLLLERRAPSQPAPDRKSLGFVGAALLVLVLSLLVMRWAGPLAVALVNLGGADLEYRLLRDTAPWKYIGFGLGGWMLVTGLVALCDGRSSGRAALAGLVVVIVLIAVFDLPFDDLLLPPNGDV